MVENSPSLVKHIKFTDQKSSANLKQQKFKENYAGIYPNQTIKNQRSGNKRGILENIFKLVKGKLEKNYS